ncbi:MAG: biosynthetic peptidoglycan transglycosylase, partial [Oscillospiraceae bacterium]
MYQDPRQSRPTQRPSSASPSRNPAPRHSSATPSHSRSTSASSRTPPHSRNEARPTTSQSSRGNAGGSTPPHKNKKSSGKGIVFGILRFIGCCICLGIMLVSVAAVMISLYLVDVTQDDDILLDLNNLKLSYSSGIYVKDTATGEQIEYQKLVGKENRVWKDLSQIPENLQDAFIAAEDQNFRTHSGISVKRTVFAAINDIGHKITNVYIGGVKQGASTIDQQLVKNILADDDASGIEGYARKLRELFRAYMLDQRYGKDMILEAYLNTISLTGNKGGVEVGAQDYFG